MFCFSVRFSRGRRIAALAAVLLAVLLSPAVLYSPAQQVFWTLESAAPLGDTQQQRTEFLYQAGWEASEEMHETVKIPREFDAVYQEYNLFLQQQGFDLRRFAGKEVERYQYRVSGHGENGMATLLVYEGRIIGGDVSVEGKMHGVSAQG